MIKIFIVDDRYLMQETIKAILKSEPEIEIVGTAKDGQDAIFRIEKLKPDIVLLDIEMPKVNGIVATKYIRQFSPETKVIILSGHNNQNYITQALEAGASSYLLKESLIEDLKQAIYSLSRGYSYIEARLLNQALDRIRANNIVNAKKKPTQVQKYRQHIYIPSSHFPEEQLSSGFTLPHNNTSRIDKVSLAPIFEPDITKEIKTADELCASLPKISVFQSRNRQKPTNKQLLWIIIAIASFVISIIIFK